MPIPVERGEGGSSENTLPLSLSGWEITSISDPPAMKKVKRGPAKLLDELMVNEILSRLPAETVLKFRCVCKIWNAATRDNAFIHLHQTRRSKPMILLSTKGYDDESSLSLWICNPKQAHAQIFLRVDVEPRIRSKLKLFPATCHGLNLFFNEDRACVLNPSTRESVSLCFDKVTTRVAPCPVTLNVGLGCAPRTGKHKVVRLSCRWADPVTREYNVGCEVFTLGDDNSWRCIEDPPYPATEKPPAFANGCLHWIIDTKLSPSEDVVIMAFNIGTETFAVVPHPPCCSDGDVNDMYLIAADGCLCLVDDRYMMIDARADIWMLRDYNRALWVKEYSISFVRLHNNHLKFIGLYQGKVLLASFRWNKVLICYDRDSDTYKTIIGRQKAFTWLGFDLDQYFRYDPNIAHCDEWSWVCNEWSRIQSFQVGFCTESLASVGIGGCADRATTPMGSEVSCRRLLSPWGC